MVRLKTLDLSNNQIEYLEKCFTCSMPILFRLYLQSNRIKQINHDIFKINIRLLKIVLSSNGICHISSDVFRRIVQVPTVILDHNALQFNYSFHAKPACNLNMKYPNTSYCQVQKLTSLDLSHNIISELKKHTFSPVRNIATLKLDQNTIEKVNHDAFGFLPHLTCLHLAENKVRTMDMILTMLFKDGSSYLQLLCKPSDTRKCKN